MRAAFLLASLMLAGAGCADGELPSESTLDRLRILAARAVPAEASPGDAVTLESLTFAPGSSSVGVVWEFCTGLECPSVERRSDPEAALDAGELDPAAGLIGLEPDRPPALVVPAAILDGLEPEDRAEGTFLRLGLSAMAWPDPEDPDELEWATKDLPVSTSSEPNHNPSLGALSVGEVEVSSGDTLVVGAGARELGVVGLESLAETYTYTTTDGVVETRTESIDVRWYSDVGSFADGRWDPGALQQPGVLIAVVRDGRGGTDWAVLNVVPE